MERKAVKAFVVVALSILVILEPSFAVSDLSLDVGSATKTTYSKLLTDIRNNVKDPDLKYGDTDIPVMAAEAPKKAKLLLIDLKTSGGETITIGISKEDKFNLYVQGYLDKITIKNKEVLRAHIFPDASAYATKNMFPEVPAGANRITMKYKSAYGDIEKKGGDRTKLGLGVEQLNKFINNVYGKPIDQTTIPIQAQLMLIVIQTIAEATRFKYIEEFILDKFDSFDNKPDPKTIELEKSWQKITKAIKSSKKGVISPELDLTYDPKKPWKVSEVSQIAPDMGLLKYEGKSSSVASRFYKMLMNVFKVNNNNNIGDGEAAEL